MKQEIHDLIEAVRGLGLKLTGQPAPKCIRITGDPSDFAIRLEQVQRALEILDASGSLSEADDPVSLDPKNDPDRLRKALDGLIRFIQVKGGNFQEADAIVRDALALDSVEDSKKKKGSGTLPTFTPSKLKKKKGATNSDSTFFPTVPVRPA